MPQAGHQQGIAPPAPQPPHPNLNQHLMPALPVQHNTYREAYMHPTTDPFQGNYINLYNEYNVGTTTPLDLRNAIYRDGNNGVYLNILMHVRDPAAAPADPGLIVGYHRLTRRDTRLGQVPLPFDGQGLAYFGDVLNGQSPTTVVIPDPLYNQLPVVQVPTGARFQQLFAAEPERGTFGPFAAGDPDVEAVVTRGLIVIPNKYVVPFLTAGMTPKTAYNVLLGLITQDGNEVACAPLLDWLRVTLTHRGPGPAQDPARTCHKPLSPPAFVRPEDQQAFATYRLEILHRDLPHIQPGVHHNSAVLIAQGLTALTDEQRLARQDAELHRQSKDALKTATDYFGVLLERIMRWCQVASEQDLPPIYETIANTKKGKIRLVLQTAIEEALTHLRYIEEFPVSPPLATKIVELKWHSAVKEDFTVGLNIFCLGSLDDETMEDQRRINHHADTIASGSAAPSLLDVATIHDGKHDVCIPRTFAQLRYCVERSQALWHVLLGPQHPLTVQHKRYREQLVSQEKSLERTLPRNPSHRYLVPALLARVIQLEVNHWLGTQMRTATAVPFAPLTEVFADIERERPWEPSFPARYIQLVDPMSSGAANSSATLTPGFAATIAGGTATTGAVSTLSGASTVGSFAAASATPQTTPRNTMVRNISYRAALFEDFKALGIRIGKLKDALRERNVKMPRNVSGQPMCLAYHVLGYCNERCNSSKDHMTHTEKEDKDLHVWCKEHFKLE